MPGVGAQQRAVVADAEHARGAAPGAALEVTAISSNSPDAAAARRRAPAGPRRHQRAPRPRPGARAQRDAIVEHAVDVAVAVGAAEALGQLDRLVDDDAIRHLELVRQLEGADAAGSRARPATARPTLAVEVRRELRDAARRSRGSRRASSVVEVLGVGLVEARRLARAAPRWCRRPRATAALVEPLHRELARARPRARAALAARPRSLAHGRRSSTPAGRRRARARPGCHLDGHS